MIVYGASNVKTYKWYMHPHSKYYGVRNDWNQTLTTIINIIANSGKDRVAYGRNLVALKVTSNKIESDSRRQPRLICHPYRRALIESLKTYSDLNDSVNVSNREVMVLYDNTIDQFKMKYVEGLYEDEIQLINESFSSEAQIEQITLSV